MGEKRIQTDLFSCTKHLSTNMLITNLLGDNQIKTEFIEKEILVLIEMVCLLEVWIYLSTTQLTFTCLKNRHYIAILFYHILLLRSSMNFQVTNTDIGCSSNIATGVIPSLNCVSDQMEHFCSFCMDSQKYILKKQRGKKNLNKSKYLLRQQINWES